MSVILTKRLGKGSPSNVQEADAARMIDEKTCQVARWLITKREPNEAFRKAEDKKPRPKRNPQGPNLRNGVTLRLQGCIPKCIDEIYV